MRKVASFLFLIYLVPVFLLNACVNLKEVNQFAAGSLKSLEKFEDLGYSFGKACSAKCLVEQLEKQELLKVSCSCDAEKTADSVNLVIFRALKGYFDGLSSLSANELTHYRFSPLTRALTEGKFGELRVNKQEAEAYAKIAGILSRALTDGYRRKKISIYIGEANAPLLVLLGAFENTLESNLLKRIETQKERLKSYYSDLYADPGSSLYEKKKILEDYHAETEELDRIKKQIRAYSRSLGSVSRGHGELYNNRARIKSAQVRELMAGYASDITDIIHEFNKIKNEN